MPDRLAIIDKRRPEVTYRDLDVRATRFGNALLDLGVKAGDHVGVLATNCIEWVESDLRDLQDPGALNINLRYVEDSFGTSSRISRPVALVYQREYGPLVTASARYAQPKLQHFYASSGNGSDADDSTLEPIEFEAAVRGGSPATSRLPVERSGDDVYLLYTGGTTGMPKGVMWRHEDVYLRARRRHRRISGERATSPHPRSSEKIDGRTQGLVDPACPPLMHGAGQFSDVPRHSSKATPR